MTKPIRKEKNDWANKIFSPEILIISPAENPEAKETEKYLKNNSPNIGTFILDTSLFPRLISCNFFLNDEKLKLKFALQDKNLTVSLDKLRSVWWWRPKPPQTGEQGERHSYVYSESLQLFNSMFQIINCLWVNHPVKQDTILNPICQARLATLSGFQVPDILVTNEPESIKKFWDKNDHNLLYQQMTLEGNSSKKLTEKYFEQPENFRLAPILFKKEIRFQSYLRVIIIGNSMNCFEQNGDNIKKVDTPGAIEKSLKKFVKFAELSYTGINFGIDSKYNYIFDSINPYTPFLEFEKKMGIPFTELVANLLLSRKSLNFK